MASSTVIGPVGEVASSTVIGPVESVTEHAETLLAPTPIVSEGSTLTNQSILMLSWTAVSDVSSISYEVMVDDALDFSSPDYQSSTTKTELEVSTLEDGVYYWRVRTNDNQGNTGDWSSSQEITIDTTAPVMTQLGSSLIDATTLTYSVTVTDSLSNIVKIEYCVNNEWKEVGTFTPAQSVEFTFTVPPTLSENSDIYVRVIDAAGNEEMFYAGSAAVVSPSSWITFLPLATLSILATGWSSIIAYLFFRSLKDLKSKDFSRLERVEHEVLQNMTMDGTGLEPELLDYLLEIKQMGLS